MQDNEFSIAIMRNGGIGIGSGALNRSDRPLLAMRIAIARDIERVRRTWSAAAPADREAFWAWLFPQSE
jgi:hypothetical protein